MYLHEVVWLALALDVLPAVVRVGVEAVVLVGAVLVHVEVSVASAVVAVVLLRRGDVVGGRGRGGVGGGGGGLCRRGGGAVACRERKSIGFDE